MSIKTELQGITAVMPSLTHRVLAALRAIDQAAADLDGLASPSTGERVRGGTTSSVVERAAGALSPLLADRAAILTHIAALQDATARLVAVCDRYADVTKPTQCIGGAGYDWWPHRRTSLAECTNWAAVGVNGTPNRGGLCDTCARCARDHGKAAA